MCVQSYLCHIRVACVCVIAPPPLTRMCVCVCVAADTVTPPNMAVSPLLSRSRSIGSSRFISRATLHKTHCSRDTHADFYSENVVLVEITWHKNANAIGTAIPQQLRDSQPLYNVYTLCLDKHDTTGSERHTHTGPAHSVNGIFCPRFFYLFN